MSRMLVFALLFSILFGLSAGASRAEDLSPSQLEAEAKEAAEEAKEQAKKEAELDRPQSIAALGKVVMKAPDERQNDGVIGTLIAGDKVYALKPAHGDITTLLAKFDGKKAHLEGYPRNKGKYFVVTAVGNPPSSSK